MTRLILGFDFHDAPIWTPDSGGSRIVYAAAGGGKTTCVAMPSILSALSDTGMAIVSNDVKSGEISFQTEPVCVKHKRLFGVIDDTRVMGADYPHRINLNPFGAIAHAHEIGSEDLAFIIEGAMRALIDEPPNDQKQFYWRQGPRDILEVGTRALLLSSTGLCTPGALYVLLAEPDLFDGALALCLDEGDEATKALANQVIGTRDTDQNFAQHMQAALQAIKIYQPGSPLHSAGQDAEHSHLDLIEDGWVICVVNPVQHAARMGAHFALHALGFMEAQLSKPGLRTLYVYDELGSTPLRDAVSRITVMRAYGATGLYITQSRQDLVRRYGEKETAVLEENAVIKQYLKFSSFEEAERVSRAIGEQLSIQKGLGTQSGRLDLSGNYSVGKERIFTADELMRLPPDEQILHVAGVGWIHAKKARQNQIMPYAAELGDNPLEGVAMPPDPKITLMTPAQRNGANTAQAVTKDTNLPIWARFWSGGVA
jgi:type IV secretion system protein VirD4